MSASKADIFGPQVMSALPPITTEKADIDNVGFVPCVDGSALARAFLHVSSIGRCSHVFGLFARFT
jgi:hypothetical protein